MINPNRPRVLLQEVIQALLNLEKSLDYKVDKFPKVFKQADRARELLGDLEIILEEELINNKE